MPKFGLGHVVMTQGVQAAIEKHPEGKGMAELVHIIHNRHAEGDWCNAGDLDAQWDVLWERFMGGVDWTGLDDVRMSGWQRKLHIFIMPFYFVEYGLALIGALQVWRTALRDHAAAVAGYRAALQVGHTRPLSGLFGLAGADFAFDRTMMGNLGRLLHEQIVSLRSA